MAAIVPCSGVAGGQAHAAHAGAPTSGFFADVSLGHSGREPTDERSRTKVCATKHMDPPPALWWGLERRSAFNEWR